MQCVMRDGKRRARRRTECQLERGGQNEAKQMWIQFDGKIENEGNRTT